MNTIHQRIAQKHQGNDEFIDENASFFSEWSPFS